MLLWDPLPHFSVAFGSPGRITCPRLNPGHTCDSSAASKSASSLLVAIFAKHFVQIESKVFSLFFLWAKVGRTDLASSGLSICSRSFEALPSLYASLHSRAQAVALPARFLESAHTARKSRLSISLSAITEVRRLSPTALLTSSLVIHKILLSNDRGGLLKKPSQCLFGLLASAVLCVAQSANAAPVGTLTCSTSTEEIKFNVSYFTFGIQTPTSIGSSSTGAGAGKATLQPLDVHAALSTFGSLVQAASTGEHIASCTLTTTLPDGAPATFGFKELAIQSLTAVASMTGNRTDPARFTDVQLVYAAVEVKGAGGTDDGGTTVPPGWNVVTNSSN